MNATTLTVTERFAEYGRVTWTARHGRTVVAEVEVLMENGMFDSDVLRRAVVSALGGDPADTYKTVRYERKRSDGGAIVPRLMHVSLI